MLVIWQEDIDTADEAVVHLQASTTSLRDIIASALAKQRERAAQIAEQYRPGDPIARQIAHLIRTNQEAG